MSYVTVSMWVMKPIFYEYRSILDYYYTGGDLKVTSICAMAALLAVGVRWVLRLLPNPT